MSTAENKALVRRFIQEAYNEGNMATVDTFIADDYIDHAQGVRGPEGVKQIISDIRTAFPDLQITLEDVIAEGDMVAVRMTTSHTHQGPFMGLAPTGRHGSHTGMAFVRVVEGQIVELWEEADMLGLLQQLGAVSLPETA